MQSIEHRIISQDGQIVAQVCGCHPPDDSALVQYLVSLFRMRCKKGVNLLFLHARRINILSWRRWFNRQKWLAFVFQCGGNWTLIEAIERQQISRDRRRARSPVNFNELAT